MKMVAGTDLPVATRRRLICLHKKMTWRAIAELYGVSSHRWPLEWAEKGIMPSNLEACYRMGLKCQPKPAWLGYAVKFLRDQEVGELIIGPRVYDRRGKLVKP